MAAFAQSQLLQPYCWVDPSTVLYYPSPEEASYKSNSEVYTSWPWPWVNVHSSQSCLPYSMYPQSCLPYSMYPPSVTGYPNWTPNLYKLEHETERPKYPSRLKDSDSGWVNKVDKIDITKLFRTSILVTNHGYWGTRVPVADLKNKHVVVACFFYPRGYYENEIRMTLTYLWDYVRSLQEKNLKVVLVVKMRKNSASDKDSYYRFLSGFPSDFLTIPWSDSASRDYIAWSLGMNCSTHAGIVVDPTGKVVYGQLDILISFGSASYPFGAKTTRHLTFCDTLLHHKVDPRTCPRSHFRDLTPQQAELLERYSKSPLTLESIYEIYGISSHDLKNDFYKFEDGYISRASLSELEGKIVGLYLCYDGYFMKDLDEIYQECRNRNPGFEVVFIPLALKEDRVHFKCDMQFAKSWFGIPHDDRLCRSLWRICGEREDDTLIILPYKNLHCGELCTRAVIDLAGKHVYPFTRERLIEERLSAIRRVTLPSLLGNFECVSGTGVRISVDQVQSRLQGKLTLLCFGSDTLEYVCNKYPMIYAHFPNCQLVLIPSDSESKAGNTPLDDKLLIFPAAAYSAFDSLFSKELGETYRTSSSITAFGENGCICSRKPERFLIDSKIASLFDDHLADEVANQVDKDVEFRRNNFYS